MQFVLDRKCQKDRWGWVGTGRDYCSIKWHIYVYHQKEGSRGVATYTQKRKYVHILTKNMEIFYHNSKGFFILHVSVKCKIRVRRTNINLSKPNFDSICDPPPQRHPLMICHKFAQMNEGLIVYIFNYELPLLRVCKDILANSTDADETSRFAASHLGLRCL